MSASLRGHPTSPVDILFIMYATVMWWSRSTTTIEPPYPPQKQIFPSGR
jgi:hypothetical protein